jgi:hypothetical protein
MGIIVEASAIVAAAFGRSRMGMCLPIKIVSSDAMRFAKLATQCRRGAKAGSNINGHLIRLNAIAETYGAWVVTPDEPSEASLLLRFQSPIDAKGVVFRIC